MWTHIEQISDHVLTSGRINRESARCRKGSRSGGWSTGSGDGGAATRRLLGGGRDRVTGHALIRRDVW